MTGCLHLAVKVRGWEERTRIRGCTQVPRCWPGVLLQERQPTWSSAEAETVPNCSSPKQLTCITGSDNVHCDTGSAGD